ncbi:DUF86 domain-containing protein [Paenibacillus sp. LMG 31456]|uniref:DUF86 domain-containing protein n=1 Tax=Paenibacillus foliorum TaxID=2654974 RepID=A0A972K5H7_9BACL|nr:HepT-like ribonuclease domain-containing protein [Paenibacillus foliorum]NOU98018.1 DUF86 domain-containing protein [Paenibacillus foliorum]
MYYVNHEQVDLRLRFIPILSESCERLAAQWENTSSSDRLLLQFAQERTLHLAIETVTDVGSLLIDAFMMRDASSYEDIIEILQGEGVFEPSLGATLRQLVQLRKPLVQDYSAFPREILHPLISELPSALSTFAEAVPVFIRKEMV